ncbi:MAG TPA: Na-translocating system protein MpsC family protein [Solirubrobacteraceae bacterium]|nr:Na-translocating system protein MpsC family protein [Solirubrobacteraceae bacterium]
MVAAISDEMVRLYKNQFGRGPTKARTYWCGDDAITVLLEDTFTPAERNLVQMGEHERLRETRMFFQYATVREFCEPVERLTGRKVRAFISGLDTEVQGLACEVFALHPAGADAPSRAEHAEL